MLLFIILCLVVAVCATLGLYFASTYYKRQARRLEGVPVSEVGDIEEDGKAKVIGKVVALAAAIRSPLTRAKCVYFRILIEEKQKAADDSSGRDEGGNRWQTVVDEAESVAFAVEDHTGMADIAPTHLKIGIGSSRRIDSGYMKSLSDSQEKMLAERYPDVKFSYTKKMRYEEIRIEEGDELAVTGEVDLSKNDRPLFRGDQKTPVRISDQTRNREAEASRSKATSSLLSTRIAGLCTMAIALWLIVFLASPNKPTPSSNGNETVDNAPPKDGRPNNNPPNESFFNDPQFDKLPVGDRPINQKAFENPMAEERLPRGDDVPTVLGRLKAKSAKNDAFGTREELEALNRLFTPEIPKRAEVLKELLALSQNPNGFINADAWRTAQIWMTTADVPMICTMLKDELNFRRQNDLLRKLGELKDPRSVATLAPLLSNIGMRDEVAAALKAIGSPAEKPLLPYLKPANAAKVRVVVIQILERVGSKESAAAIDALLADTERSVADQAKHSLDQMAKRTNYERNVENLLTALAAQAKANEFFNSQRTFRELGAAYKIDHPKRAEVFAALQEVVKTTKHPVLRNVAVQEMCRWGTKDDVPQLCELLVSIKNDEAESILLARLQGYGDPRSAEAVASFMNGFKKAEAAAVLRAIGSPAEKFLHPFTKATTADGKPNPFFNRVPAIELLGDIGTKESVPLLKDLSVDRDQFTKNAAQQALQKVLSRQ